MQIRGWMKGLNENSWSGRGCTGPTSKRICKLWEQVLLAGWLRAIPGPSAAPAPQSLGLVPIASSS